MASCRFARPHQRRRAPDARGVTLDQIRIGCPRHGDSGSAVAPVGRDEEGATKTRSGLQVKARLDKRQYPLGMMVPDETMDTLHLKPHEFHGEWNYTFTPESL